MSESVVDTRIRPLPFVDEASVAIVKGLGAKAAVVWLLALVNDSLVQRHEMVGVEPLATLLAGEVLIARVPQHVKLEIALVGELPAALFANTLAFTLQSLTLYDLLLGHIFPRNVLFFPLGFCGRWLR